MINRSHAAQVLAIVSVAVFLSCSEHASVQRPSRLDAEALVVAINTNRPVIYSGTYNSYDAMDAWLMLREAVDYNDTDALKVWLEFQMELVDRLADSDPPLARQTLQVLYFQDMHYSSQVLPAYRDWVLEKKRSNAFSDPDMRRMLDEEARRYEEVDKAMEPKLKQWP